MKKLFLSSLLLTNILVAQEPSYGETNNHNCYKSREILYPLDETFDAIKQTIMQSNLNIVTVTKADGIITARGTQVNESEDTALSLTLTVDFKQRDNNITSVKTIAFYETRELQNDTGQLGASGITLPIPVPFTGKYMLVGQGSIDDSLWYQGFYNSLQKILFENTLKYK